MSSAYARAVARVGQAVADKYELRRLLGVGSTGAVYEALHRFTGRQVAVKLLHDQLLDSTEHVARFLQEARAVTALGHPSIVEVFDAGRTMQGELYLVTELLEGEDLGHAMEEGSIATADILDAGVQLLEGLAAAHGHGIIHRDVKPENVFLAQTPSGRRVKLLDFGISKRWLESGSNANVITLQGMTVGTPYYMSPEQARGTRIDARADIWSSGAVLFHALAGIPPFDDANLGLLLAKIVSQPAPSLGDFRPDLPEAVVGVIDRALKTEAVDRWQTAQEMAIELRGRGASISGLDWDD